MLYEIYCDKFYQKQIKFNNSLSVILGTNNGDNSIGKSTFLLIVDFVFGGNTYATKEDIITNVGKHDIFFAFKFAGKIFKFCRNNQDTKFVWICNDNYECTEKIELTKYCQWLNKQYKINLPDLSFRNAVGRYMRIYGKDNCDENHPLHYLPNEKSDKAVYSLIQLFNRYLPIKDLRERVNESDEELKAYKKAQKLDFICNVTSKEYEQNKKEIEHTKNEIETLASGLNTALLDIDAAASEEAVELKKVLSRLKRYRTKSKLLLDSIEENTHYKFVASNHSLEELTKFFPNANIRHIEEIENFHKKISEIFKDELRSEKHRLEKEISEYDIEIHNYEEQLKSLIKDPNLSKIILSQHARLLKNIDIKQNENKAYEKLQGLNNDNKEIHEKLEKMEAYQLGIIESLINKKMADINNMIYNGTCNPPIIHFTNTKYNFYTENDTGTGIAFKGLVVFDLSVLNLTPLPLLVHDSVILKQISDLAIEKIIKLYIENNKQVIIALDKQSSYGQQTEGLLNKYSVLKLSSGGQELFGRSWG